jgi:hypothetical protein
MANRVTEEDVLAIMPDNTKLTDYTISPYITSANVFVTDLLENKHPEVILIEIEKWLAAHMATVTKERLAKEAGAGGANIKYAGEWGMELSSTQYGQMVLMLDTSNTLRNLKDGKKQAWTYAVEGE